MENEKREQYQKEFITLWHRLLKLDQDLHLAQKYPSLTQLSVNEISVIDIVSRKPEVILKEIGSMLDLPKSTLTNMINRLEKKGYLFRTIAKQDLRSYGLELTEQGKQAQKEHLEYETMYFRKIMDALGEEDQQQLIQIVGKIVHAFETDQTTVS